ncbi:hypothetical protein PMSM_14545 [Paenibacillus macquariensis subsp. macquariensis]|nr:hypothetical protein PMSM_14545 [Paenibacillus macquariensis subsp. macquariensis]
MHECFRIPHKRRLGFIYQGLGKSDKCEIEANGSKVIIRGGEDILKLRDKLNELYPVKEGE